MTTAELIEKLKELDPEGTSPVTMMVGSHSLPVRNVLKFEFLSDVNTITLMPA